MSLWYNNGYSAGQSVASNNNSHKSSQSGNKDHNFLQTMVGKNAKINRGGPESLQGKLHSVKSDYLVLVTSEGVVYVATSHVKSVTEAGAGNTSSGSKGNRSGSGSTAVINASNFNGIIRALNQTFVQLNSGGPEKVEGFIAQAGNNSILLVSGKEAMQIQNYHIKSIKAASNRSGGNNNNKNENKNSNANNNSKNENKSNSKNENKSDSKNNNKNKTQGNRSGGKSNANAAAVKTTRSSVKKS